MFLLYLMCMFPLIIGLILWLYHKEITWIEWIVGTLIAFITVGVIHVFLVFGMTLDKEILSGHIIKATYYPEWVERYSESHCSSYNKDGMCTSYYTDYHFRTHNKYYDAKSSTGESRNIKELFFNTVKDTFNNYIEGDYYKPGFYSGDPNVYVTYNKSGKVYFPTTINRSWKNIIKATKSNFSFIKIDKNIKTIPYPYSEEWMISKRLIGISNISIYDWDVLNAELGSLKHVNLIMINFGNKVKEEAIILESAWLGGKQNDLVLCYGGDNISKWTYVFGWTEQMLVKRNLETILLTNNIDKNIIPLIKQEVINNYTMKDFNKFNYMQITPPFWSYILTFIIICAVQTIYYIFTYTNDSNKN